MQNMVLLPKTQLTHPATLYVGVPIVKGTVGLHIAWYDATSSATITFETTCIGERDAPVSEAGSAWEWVEESYVTITGPTASAAGASTKHMENVHAARARLKIVTAADTLIAVFRDPTGGYA